MALSLPSNPDLERFRRDARRLERAVRTGDMQALALVARHHPGGPPTQPDNFSLAAAQLVVARSHGFASWPRLRHFLDLTNPLRRDPTAALSTTDPVSTFCTLAVLQYGERDEPDRWSRAARILDEHPDLPSRSVHAAAAVGDPDAVAAHLARDVLSASAEGGPFQWAPLLYLTYSRVPQVDAVATARLLLDHGADPNAGYLWQGLTPPFTALTGCFGEGEQGPGRQPRHPEWNPLARLLLEGGAEANDGQTLYNRMFGRDDGHLVLLFEFGLDEGDGGVWRRRLGEALPTPAEMMAEQVAWAQEHGFTQRLALLARHGFAGPPTSPVQSDIHRAGSPEAVARVAAAGGDVDAYQDGRTALHHHAWIGDVEMVRALLGAGANPDLVDATHGTTPLVWAEYARQPATAELLRPVTSTG